MCEFVSWIEKGQGEKKKVIFLTGKQVFETKKGQQLFKDLSNDDFIGHGGIRRYYGLEQDEGRNKECTDFSSPENFPLVIANAIKNGEMRGMPIVEQLLNTPAWAECNKICNTARAECNKICNTAWAEYNKICNTAWAEYNKIYNTARAEYNKICTTAFWDLFADPDNRIGAWR
jgi:hypothetical protein